MVRHTLRCIEHTRTVRIDTAVLLRLRDVYHVLRWCQADQIVVLLTRVEEVTQLTVVTFSLDGVAGNHRNQFGILVVTLIGEGADKRVVRLPRCPGGRAGGPGYIGRSCRIGRVLTVTLAEILVITQRCLTVVCFRACCTGQPQVQVAQQDGNGEPHHPDIIASDGTIARIFAMVTVWNLTQVVDEVLTDGCQVVTGIIGLRLHLGQDRLRHEGYTTIIECQLQVGPCTDGLHGSILFHEDILITVVLQGRVGMSDEIVTVVDDGIVVAGYVIAIIVLHVKQCHVSQVTVGYASHINQVAAHLTQQDSAVGNHLQFVQDAGDRIDRVGGTVKVLTVSKDDML